MSYRKDVRGRVARGEYVQKSNALEEGFAKAADIVAKSWMDTAAQEKADAKALAKDQAEKKKKIVDGFVKNKKQRIWKIRNIKTKKMKS